MLKIETKVYIWINIGKDKELQDKNTNTERYIININYIFFPLNQITNQIKLYRKCCSYFKNIF